MKKCRFCAEEIQDDAVKCKHCGEFLKKRWWKSCFFSCLMSVVILVLSIFLFFYLSFLLIKFIIFKVFFAHPAGSAGFQHPAEADNILLNFSNFLQHLWQKTVEFIKAGSLGRSI